MDRPHTPLMEDLVTQTSYRKNLNFPAIQNGAYFTSRGKVQQPQSKLKSKTL